MKQDQGVENGRGIEIRKKRIELQLSQEDVAFEADISQTSVSRVERGGRSSRRVVMLVVDTLNRLEAEKARRPGAGLPSR